MLGFYPAGGEWGDFPVQNQDLTMSIQSSQVSGQPLTVPSSWARSYPRIFNSTGSKELCVRLENPTALTTVIVTALSNEAYFKASKEHHVLEQLLFANQPILREGDTLVFREELPLTHEYRLEMLEPVQQGFAEHGPTKIILLSSQEDSVPSTPSTQDESIGAHDLIEIDEGFLASSILTPSLDSPRDDPGFSAHPQTNTSGSPLRYIPKGLGAAIDHLNDHCTLYLRASDLGRLGILSGDWVCLSESHGSVPIFTRMSRQSQGSNRPTLGLFV